MIWILFALLASVLFAVQSEVNKHYKFDGLLLNIVQSFFSVLLLVPFIGLMEWPADPVYYLVAVLCAASGAVSMMVLYNLAARKNGRVACLYQPLAVILTFIFWLFIDPVQRTMLLGNPINLMAIAAGFFIFTVGVVFIRRNDIGWQALVAVIPIAVLFSVDLVLTKLFLDKGSNSFWIAVNFVFLTNVFMFLLSLPIAVSQTKYNNFTFFSGKFVVVGMAIAVLLTFSWVLINMALIYTPNPAYVSMMDGLIPVWFMLYYKWRGISDDASPKAGLLIALAAIIILFAVNY